MTDVDGYALPEDFWDRYGSDDDEAETVSVRERVEEALDADRIHGITVTRRQEGTVYAVATSSTTWDRIDEDVEMNIPVLDVRTVVIDFDADSVRVSDNGLWIPQEAGVAEGMTQALARAKNDLSGSVAPDAEPALMSAVEGMDPEMLLDREIEVEQEVEGQHVDMMKRHGGIDPKRPWGYGAGPPPEVHEVAARLEEAGLDPSEHFTRLVFGKKEPFEVRDRRYGPDELVGNYGIELEPRDSGLIAIDVDYPEAFPEEFDLPETYEVSSPHGDDTRRHVLLRCDDKKAIAEQVGAWAVQAVEWGDLWIGDRYVVGPGSQLSEFGCDNGEHTRGEPGGCSECEDEDGGYYEVVNDAPIATVDAEFVLDLLEASDTDEAEPRDGPADPDPPEPEPEDEEEGSGSRYTCDSCGAVHDSEETMKVMTLGNETRRICRGDCGG